MDLLKKELAPISTKSWAEIEKRAQEVLRSQLSARKAVKVKGPMGWDYTYVPEGRLEGKEEGNEVKAMNYAARPLTETRIEFTLDRWELDNIERGAENPDLGTLEEAAKKIAIYEEEAIYKGNPAIGIKGLDHYSKGNTVKVEEEGSGIMKAITEASIKLRKKFETPPYVLIAGKKFLEKLNTTVHSYQITKWINEYIGTEILFSFAIENALMIPQRSSDLELTIGGDFSIGYQSHDARKVKLFISESFTFRVLNPEIVVKLEV
jgi:uncharacterized linocin/CFP29 family protein